MDGTKLRTVLAIATSINTALIALDLSSFDNEQVNLWYKIISLVLNFIIVAITTYFNNDYTDEGAVGTAITRQLKDDPTLIVDVYDGDEDEEPEDGEVEADVEIDDDADAEEGEPDEVE